MNPTNFSSLPPKFLSHVVETLHQDCEAQATIKNSCYHPTDRKRKVGRDVAKSLAPLSLVNSAWMRVANTVLNQHEGTELAATQESIRHFAMQADLTQVQKKHRVSILSHFLGVPDQPMFRHHMARLIQQHKHISVPFKALDLLQSRVVLEELENAPNNHLAKVVLDFSEVRDNTWYSESHLAECLNRTLNTLSQNQSNCLIELSVYNSNIAKNDPAVLVSLLDNLLNTKVHQLVLSGNSLGSYPELGSALAAAIKSPHLRGLSLMCSDLLSSQIQSIAQALPQSQLLELDMAMNAISSDAMDELNKNLPNSKLKILRLANCQIQGLDIVSLANALPNTQLECLDLRLNSTRDEGGVAIARALKNSKLNHLDLRLNGIGPIGGEAIALALPDSDLAYLDLEMNCLKDEGLLAFARTIGHCSKLKTLILESNSPLYMASVYAVERAELHSSYPLDLLI